MTKKNLTLHDRYGVAMCALTCLQSLFVDHSWRCLELLLALHSGITPGKAQETT